MATLISSEPSSLGIDGKVTKLSVPVNRKAFPNSPLTHETLCSSASPTGSAALAEYTPAPSSKRHQPSKPRPESSPQTTVPHSTNIPTTVTARCDRNEVFTFFSFAASGSLVGRHTTTSLHVVFLISKCNRHVLMQIASTLKRIKPLQE